MKTALLLVIVGVALGGCDRSDSSADPEPTSSSATTEAEPAAPGPVEPTSQPQTATADNWMKVESGELNGAQQAQLDRATSAQKELGMTLLKALTTSIGEEGLPQSITFCKEEAPKLAASVAEARAVKIGRTSARLRNPDNSGPSWVADARQRAGENQTYFAGPDGEFGLVSPIRTAELCTKCHGGSDAIPTEVASAIDEAYPEDAARGFKEGDLRGWFWVEVPPPS